jgi:hypothetical protein
MNASLLTNMKLLVIIFFYTFYAPVFKTGRIMVYQCPSVRPSVRSSVLLFVRPSVSHVTL